MEINKDIIKENVERVKKGLPLTMPLAILNGQLKSAFASNLYREANKDKIAEKGKAYREANKDKILAKLKRKRSVGNKNNEKM